MQNPQSKGVYIKIFTRSTKDPNSAVRKIFEVKLSTGLKIEFYILGKKYSLQPYSVVLIRGVKNKKTSKSKYSITLSLNN